MKKHILKIEKYINPSIQVGDKIKVTDGSSLSHINNKIDDLYIVNAYPSITKSSDDLRDIVGTVIKTGVTDYCVEGSFNRAYLQDAVIQLGDAQFRIMSDSLVVIEKRKIQVVFRMNIFNDTI